MTGPITFTVASFLLESVAFSVWLAAAVYSRKHSVHWSNRLAKYLAPVVLVFAILVLVFPVSYLAAVPTEVPLQVTILMALSIGMPLIALSAMGVRRSRRSSSAS